MTISRPEPSTPMSRDGRSFSDTWWRVITDLVDSVTGKLPPRIPVRYTVPSLTQPGLGDATESGQLIIAVESGTPVLAFSHGGQWLSAQDGSVIS